MAMGWLTPDRKKWLGFGAWLLFVTVVALLTRFPADMAADYAERALAERLPGYRFAIDEVAVTPLLRLRATGCRVSAAEAQGEPILQFAEVEVAPSWWGLLRGRKGVCFSGKGYGGEMEGSILLRPDSMRLEEVALHLRKMQVRRYPRLKELLGRKMAGEISGDLLLSATTGRLADGDGSVEFSLRNGEVELLQPVMGRAAFGFDEVVLALSIAKRKMSVKRFELAGREGRGRITGSAALHDRLLFSRLSLQGGIELDQNAFHGTPEGEEALAVLQPFVRNGRFRIGVDGTIAQPKIRLL